MSTPIVRVRYGQDPFRYAAVYGHEGVAKILQAQLSGRVDPQLPYEL